MPSDDPCALLHLLTMLSPEYVYEGRDRVGVHGGEPDGSIEGVFVAGLYRYLSIEGLDVANTSVMMPIRRGSQK